jgi:hypothetical protein
MVAGINCFHAAQLALTFGALLGENVKHECVRTLEAAAAQRAEPLCSAAFGFHLRHDVSFYFMLPGDPTVWNASPTRLHVLWRFNPLD